jgi:hypothetical protein
VAEHGPASAPPENLQIPFGVLQVGSVRVKTYLPPGTDPADNGTSNANTTCSGQTITLGSGGCNALSAQYGVTTGDLYAVTDTDNCSSPDEVCVPLSCSLTQATSNASW